MLAKRIPFHLKYQYGVWFIVGRLLRQIASLSLQPGFKLIARVTVTSNLEKPTSGFHPSLRFLYDFSQVA